MIQWPSIFSSIIQILLTSGLEVGKKKKAISVELGLEPKTSNLLTKRSSIDLHPQAREQCRYNRYLGGIEVGGCDLPPKHQNLVRIV